MNDDVDSREICWLIAAMRMTIGDHFFLRQRSPNRERRLIMTMIMIRWFYACFPQVYWLNLDERGVTNHHSDTTSRPQVLCCHLPCPPTHTHTQTDTQAVRKTTWYTHDTVTFHIVVAALSQNNLSPARGDRHFC